MKSYVTHQKTYEVITVLLICISLFSNQAVAYTSADVKQGPFCHSETNNMQFVPNPGDGEACKAMESVFNDYYNNMRAFTF